MCGRAKPFPWQCWGEESGRGWRGSLPGEGNPAGADNRVLCSPDESTCPSVGSRPGAPYGGDLPLAAAVPSRHGASLAGDAAPGTERSPGAEPCRMGPCEPCLCPSPVRPGNATTERSGDDGYEHQVVPGHPNPGYYMPGEGEGAAGCCRGAPALSQNLAWPWGLYGGAGSDGAARAVPGVRDGVLRLLGRGRDTGCLGSACSIPPRQQAHLRLFFAPS